MFKLIERTILIATLLFGVFIFSSVAQEGGGQITVTGDNFEIDENVKVATFTGNVVVTQKNFTLWAPRVIAKYGKGGTSDLKEVTADGGIRIEQPSQTATSDRGIYDPKTRILRMIGNVVTTQSNGNVVESAEMRVDLAADTTSFIADQKDDGGRVTAVFGSDN